MSKLDQESLFSLEVVVDKIHLSPKVSCRFPAVAFRLLDFPTLMIYHVEPQLAEAIKRNIKKDPYYQLPLQLPELQDRDSSYQVKKGKSCLMKVSPNVLLSHLQNTPLYIMIIDTYPEVPKLVGNCAVPINVVMEDVYNDINELGISVPNSHGDKGVFVISNLMGDEIGKITLGYRLLSLGIGLIPHIPDKSIAKMGQGNISHPKIEKRVAAEVARIPKPMEQEAADIILEDLEAIDKNIQVVMSTPAPAKEMTATQTQVESSRVAFTQTDYKKKKKKVKVEKKVDHPMTHFDPDLDDLFIVNVNTPPPLFYNSKADPPHVAPGLTFEDYLVHKHREVHLDEMSVSSADSDSTIRHEDKFSDSEMEIPKPKPQPEPSVVKKQVKKATQAKTISPNTNILGALSQFPLLSAIMSEIASLQGVGPSVKNEVGLPPHRTSSPHRNAITPRELPSSPRFKPVTPRPSNLSQRSSPVRQPPPPKALVKQKSWLKTEKKQQKKQGTTPQPMVVAKTKITPGMTNTQRLRLAMTNPQLLQKLEKEERERVEKFKAKRKELGEGLDFVPSQRDVYTEAKTRSADGSNDVHLHFDHHKRPIPTPRMSLSHDLEHITVSEVPHITPRISKLKGQSDPQATIVKQYPQVQARSLQKTEIITAAKKKSVPVVKVDADDLQYMDSKEAISQYTDSEEAISQVSRIDVHMPVISLHEDDAGSDPGDTTDQDDVSYDADQVPDLVARPSFPKSRSRLDSANSNDLSQHYSDDFEDSHAYQDRLEDDDLNAVADLDEDHRSEGGLELSGGEGVDPAELLGLRKMVDAYSDTEEEEEEEQGVEE